MATKSAQTAEPHIDLKEQLSALFRNIEMDLGTHGFCILVLEAFLEAICQYKIRNKEQLFEQFNEIFRLIKNVKPKYAILIDSFYKIFSQASDQTFEEITNHIREIKAYYEGEMDMLVRVADQIDVQNKNILIYDHSHSVQNALRHFKEKKHNFTVLLAEQDAEKTEDNIAFLCSTGIPFKLVPAYMISHLEETIDMSFFGAVTFQEGGQFVMDPGSKSMISELKIEEKPVYVFLTTSKFSLWEVKDYQKEIHVKSQALNPKTSDKVEFERIKFSHDRVAAKLIDYVVTEGAIFDVEGIINKFNELRAQREKDKKRLTFKGIF